ncbi:hypothetical protein [Sphingobium amiense]|uniref:hypothetical protein n=1 Tax=Sphingobium amiense TaxID=135719 RepID=UPI0008352B67|nr:hypothetical protein [Sphingobium amiense]
MFSFDRTSSHGKLLALSACSTFALLLSACESSGGLRVASVGSGAPGAGSGGSGGGSGTDNGGGAGGGTGGSGSGGSGSGSGGSGSGGSGSGTGSGGSGTGGTTTTAGLLQQVSPVLTTAGNAVLAVSDGQGNVTTPVATALPILQPVTGTITRVLNDTGTVLVDAGAGRTLLLQGAQGVVGDVVSIDVGGRTVTSGLDGTAGAVGVGLLGDTQPTGTVASVGVLNAGNTALASVNGIADVRVTNVTAPTGGVADNLLNVALGSNQLLGSGDPALVNASLLPNGIGSTGAGSATGALAPVTSVVQPVTSVVQTAGAGVTSTVQDVTGGALSPLGVSAGAGASAGTGATVTTGSGSLLAPVTGTVSNTVTTLTGGLGLHH